MLAVTPYPTHVLKVFNLFQEHKKLGKKLYPSSALSLVNLRTSCYGNEARFPSGVIADAFLTQ